MGTKAFGEQNPTQGEDAVSWQTWSDGNGNVPDISGNADWGKLKLDLSGEEGRSPVYDLGSAATRIFTLTENRYGTGSEDATLQIRGSATIFTQDTVEPTWITYSAPTSQTWRYVQVRETTGAMYFIDATGGNDDNDGLTQATAWQSITKVNTATFQPGDQILFKRGEIWKGTTLRVPSSGAPKSPIVFGAYGNGANPVLDASTEFNDFTLHSDAIWKRTQANAVNLNQVFEDNSRLSYSVDVASMVAGSCAIVSGVVYVWCTDSGNPNTGHVIDYQIPVDGLEGGIDYNGQSYLLFDSIDATKSNKFNYKLWKSGATGTGITVQNMTSNWSGAHGLYANGTSNTLVYNCVAHDNLDTGFWQGHATNIIFDGCEAYNSGADVSPNGARYPAAAHWPNGMLNSAEAIDCTIRHCYIHDCYIGYLLINEKSGGLWSTRTIFEQNNINDNLGAGGIAIEGPNTIVRNNIIRNEGSTYGIILTSNAQSGACLYNNTIISGENDGTSIYLQAGTNTKVKNNLIVRSGTSNRFISVLAAAKTGFEADRNLYYQASGTSRWFWGPTEYTSFATWKSGSSQDANGIADNPDFVTEFTNLHLQASSPCIGAGDATLGVTDDFDDVERGAAVDIGAYEYVPS